MHTKLKLACAALAVAAVIACFTLASSSRPPLAPLPATTAPLPEVALKPIAPRAAPTVMVPPPTPPVAAPTPQNPATLAATPKGNPQLDLQTAVPDFLRLLKTGDFLTLMKTYAPPDELAKMPPEVQAQIETEMQSPEMQQQMQAMITSVEYLQTQTPTYSPDGNTATYANVPDPDGNPNHPVHDMVWIKQDGLWYLKN